MTEAGAYEVLREQPWLAVALTVTAVRDADEAEVIRCFGGDPGEARPGSWLEFREAGGTYIAVSRSGSTIVVAENNGYQGSRQEVLRPLSRLGRTASAYWNVNANNRLSLAEDGLVVSSFDMICPEVAWVGTGPEDWGPLLEGLAFGVDSPDWQGAGLTAVERATGARLDASWADGSHRLVEIVPVTVVLPPQDIARSPLLELEPFADFVTRLGPGLLPELRRYALELAITHTGLTGHALVTAALAADSAPAAAREQLRDELKSAYHDGVYEARRLTITDPEDGRPEWELPSRRAKHRALVLRALADHLELGLGNPTGYRADPMTTLQGAMAGDGEAVEQFWICWKLHEAAAEAAR